METLVYASLIVRLIKQLKAENKGLLGVELESDGTLRVHFSRWEHPDLDYVRRPHSECFDQMVVEYGGAEVFYLTEKI